MNRVTALLRVVLCPLVVLMCVALLPGACTPSWQLAQFPVMVE